MTPSVRCRPHSTLNPSPPTKITGSVIEGTWGSSQSFGGVNLPWAGLGFSQLCHFLIAGYRLPGDTKKGSEGDSPSDITSSFGNGTMLILESRLALLCFVSFTGPVSGSWGQGVKAVTAEAGKRIFMANALLSQRHFWWDRGTLKNACFLYLAVICV